jgi:Spy/CpxP family protein refolding chaperone
MMRQKFLFYVGLATIIGFASAGLMLFSGHFNQGVRSPYVGQLDSPVPGLSAQEVDDWLNGRGAGYARTAELNNYPGPRHVLDLKQELALSPDQEQPIQAVFEQMQAEAKQIGQEIVQREAQFSAAFAGGAISEAGLKAQTKQLALLYGQLRAAHLQAHFQITPLLSPEQIAAYNTLRGYTSGPDQPVPGGHQHQNH